MRVSTRRLWATVHSHCGAGEAGAPMCFENGTGYQGGSANRLMRTLIPRGRGSRLALDRSAVPLIAGLAVAVLMVGLVGCSGPPDRRAEADRLQTAIDAMPGVRSAHIN